MDQYKINYYTKNKGRLLALARIKTVLWKAFLSDAEFRKVALKDKGIKAVYKEYKAV